MKTLMKKVLFLGLLAAAFQGASAFASCYCTQDNNGNIVAIQSGTNQPVQYFRDYQSCNLWIATSNQCQ